MSSTAQRGDERHRRQARPPPPSQQRGPFSPQIYLLRHPSSLLTSSARARRQPPTSSRSCRRRVSFPPTLIPPTCVLARRCQNAFVNVAFVSQSNSPLEYVKLARTKGARLLRAVETKKRTYLAVLCGDEGERIELFTVSAASPSHETRLANLFLRSQGSRSISLSLNRTFVLPENPRTIEFQLQGDDLVDICALL